MHGKGGFSKIKLRNCNIFIEAAKTCNILPRPAVFNGITFVKLKQDLKYRVYVYFEPVRLHIIYQVLAYSKSHNKFYMDVSIGKGFSSKQMFRFSDIV